MFQKPILSLLIATNIATWAGTFEKKTAKDGGFKEIDWIRYFILSGLTLFLFFKPALQIWLPIIQSLTEFIIGPALYISLSYLMAGYFVLHAFQIHELYLWDVLSTLNLHKSIHKPIIMILSMLMATVAPWGYPTLHIYLFIENCLKVLQFNCEESIKDKEDDKTNIPKVSSFILAIGILFMLPPIRHMSLLTHVFNMLHIQQASTASSYLSSQFFQKQTVDTILKLCVLSSPARILSESFSECFKRP